MNLDAKALLNTPVENVRGVGRHRAELLAKLGIRSASDLLFDFPRDYLDLSHEGPIVELDEGELQTVRGVVTEVAARSSGFGKSRVSILLQDPSGHLRATWFNQPFMRNKFREGQPLLLTAKPKMRGMMWEMSHPQVTYLAPEETTEETASEGKRMLPIYSLTEGVSQYYMRRMVEAAVKEFADVPEEVFPANLLQQCDLLPLTAAIRTIHAPEDEESLSRARRRFIFQELFVLQLALSIRRAQQQSLQAPPLPATTKIDARIRRLLPFDLTASQRTAIAEVSADMALGRPMNRLLQGDVGSGKTIVALYAMLVAVAHGKQAALMAPTEILARQHAETLASLLEASRVRFAVLAGGLDKVYPKEHTKLAQQAQEQGAVVSEYPLGVQPHPKSFPRRNRLISGMSLGTLVVEAPLQSGARWTVHHALEQNREVFCVPGSIFSPVSQFTNRMIQEGAKLVSTYTDVLEELNLTAVAHQYEMPLSEEPEDSAENGLLRHLHEEPLHIDDIRRIASLPIAAVSGMLAMLELKGKVKQVGCMHYIRIQETSLTYGN
ncbi:MAG: DNA-processing protein DprA [Planctomycetes bacterium]|nr:DNA-processing protein DprA [Planctomycetota bacterium]